MWPHLLHTSIVRINWGSSHRMLNGISVNRQHSLTVSCHYYNLFLPLFSMAFCHSKYSMNVYFWLWIWRRCISANIFAQVVSWEWVPGSLFIGYPELLMKSVGIQELDTQNSSTWVLRYCCLRTTDKPRSRLSCSYSPKPFMPSSQRDRLRLFWNQVLILGLGRPWRPGNLLNFRNFRGGTYKKHGVGKNTQDRAMGRAWESKGNVC